jgi:hypothetical protein
MQRMWVRSTVFVTKIHVALVMKPLLEWINFLLDSCEAIKPAFRSLLRQEKDRLKNSDEFLTLPKNE